MTDPSGRAETPERLRAGVDRPGGTPRRGRPGGGSWCAWPSSSAALGWVALRGLTGSFVYYLTPTDITVGHKAQVDQRVRLGRVRRAREPASAGGRA